MSPTATIEATKTIVVAYEIKRPPAAVWRAAGRAFQKYTARRREKPASGPRRILADFLIGAHASEHGYRLLTLDDHLYRAAFPALTLVRL